MYCVFCGKLASQQQGARFCLHCGKPLDSSATTNAPQKSTNATQEIKVVAPPSESAYQWPDPEAPVSNSSPPTAASTAIAPRGTPEVYGPGGATYPYNYNPYGQPPQGYYNNPSYSQYQQYQQYANQYYNQTYQNNGQYYQPYQAQANNPAEVRPYSYNPYYSIQQQRFVPPRLRAGFTKETRSARNLAIAASTISILIYPVLGILSRSSYYYGYNFGRNMLAIIVGFVAAGFMEKNPKVGGALLIVAGLLSFAAAPLGLIGGIMCFIGAAMALSNNPRP